MPSTTIQYEDATQHAEIISAQIGNCNECFEIHCTQIKIEDKMVPNYHLLVNGNEVPPYIFNAAFSLAVNDRFDPNQTKYAERIIRRRAREELLAELKAAGVIINTVGGSDDDAGGGQGGGGAENVS